MGAALGQLVDSLRGAIIRHLAIIHELSGASHTPVEGVFVLYSTRRVNTALLLQSVQVVVRNEGYELVDIEQTKWYFDGLLRDRSSGDVVARCAVTNNTKYGTAIILSVDIAREP